MSESCRRDPAIRVRYKVLPFHATLAIAWQEVRLAWFRSSHVD
jgi:hypothetical protein